MDENKNSLNNHFNLTSDNPKHWTKQIKSSTICKDKHGSLNLIILGGACEASFPYVASIDHKKIKYANKSVKLAEGDVMLEIGGEGVGGCTLEDVIELISRLPTQVPLKTVPADILDKSLSLYLNERFSKNSPDHCLQQTIRRNIYKRALPCTTRPPREDEVDGVDYKFLTVEEFFLLEEGGRLLEKGKYEGNYYGTLKPQLTASSLNATTATTTTAAVATNHIIPWAGLPEHLYSMVKKSKPPNNKIQQFKKQHSQQHQLLNQHQHINNKKLTPTTTQNSSTTTFSIHPPPLPKHILTKQSSSDTDRGSSSSPPLPPYTISSAPSSSSNKLNSNMGTLAISSTHGKSANTIISLNNSNYNHSVDINTNHHNFTNIYVANNAKTSNNNHTNNNVATIHNNNHYNNNNNNTTLTNNNTFSNNNTNAYNYSNTYNSTYTHTKSSSSSPFSTGSITTVINAHPPSTQLGFPSFSDLPNYPRQETDGAVCNSKILPLTNFNAPTNETDTNNNNTTNNINNNHNNLDNNNKLDDIINNNHNINNINNKDSEENISDIIKSDNIDADNTYNNNQLNNNLQPQQQPNQLLSNNKQTANPPQQLIHTTLVKGGKGLGFTIIGVEDDESEGVWLVVKNVASEGPAALDGKLKRGDVLVSVNHREVCGLTHQDVVSMFKGIEVDDNVTLEVVRGHYSTLNFDLLEATQQKDDSLEVVTTMAVVGDGGDEDGVVEEVEVLVLKGGTGFGFTLADRPGGQKVKQVVDSERCQGLRQGDLLIQVNSLSLVNLPHLVVVDLLKSLPIGGPAKFLLQRKASSNNSKSNSKSNSGNNTHDNSTSSSTLNLNNSPHHPQQQSNRQIKQHMQLPVQHCYHDNNPLQPQQQLLKQQHLLQQHHSFFSGQVIQPSLQTPDFIPDIAFKDPHVVDVISNTNNNINNNNINNQICFPQQQLFSPQQHFNISAQNPFNIYNNNLNNTFNNNLNNNLNNLNLNNNPLQGIIQIVLRKSQHGFGFRIIGGREEGSQVSIGLIVPGGPADLSGVMKLGQEILFIDHRCVMGAWHKDVVDLVLMASKIGTVQLGLSNTIYAESIFLDHLNNNISNNHNNCSHDNHNNCSHDNHNNCSHDNLNNHNGKSVAEVVLTRSKSEGFGFYILSSSSKQAPVIGEIIEGSAASRCPELRVGSEIVMINDRVVTGMSHCDVVEVIKVSGSAIKLMVVNFDGAKRIAGGVGSCNGSLEGCDGGCDGVGCEGGDIFVDRGLASHYAVGNQIFQQQLQQQQLQQQQLQQLQQQQSTLKSPMMLMTSHSPSPAFQTYPQQQQQIQHHIQQQQEIQQHLQQQQIEQLQQDVEVMEVGLVRGHKGYGFSIRGGRDFNNSPMLVCKMVDGGVAKTDGRLQVGDELVSINGLTTQGLSQQEAINAIQAANENLNLKIKRFNATEAIEDL